ncbi:MAG: trigger factor [Chloroflexi bacterium]|nr:trigger factor [Chloroflexota bacterium]MCY3587632.1 trigger factor [Chloroflexota bacterium]MCY3686413.1 trigger factor [Chloroflexota bacterium]MDE2708137.1 trigger factor [Chloroflexota bacterium]
MKVSSERIPEAQMLLEIELDDARVKKSLDQAARRLSQRFRIPGFRQGKAPRRVVESALGADMVFEEAAERLIPQALTEALEQEELDPVAQPSIEITGREPVTFTATVPLTPEVELGDYRSISIAKPESEFSEEMVEERLLELRRQHALLEPVEREPELDDRVTADVRAEVDGEQILDQPGAEFHLREGAVIGVPGLSEKLVGVAVGEEHSIPIDVDEDWDDEEVAGKTVVFTVTIHDVKSEELPEADDDFAMEVSEEFETFSELRERVESGLREQTERQADEQFSQAVMQAAVDRATLEYPPALVEHEIEHMRQDFARQMGQDPATFLRDGGEQGEQLMASFRTQANERVINTLVLQNISEAEDIQVLDEEVTADLEQMLAGMPTQDPEQTGQMLEDEGIRANVQARLVRERTVERLQQIALTNHAAGVSDDVIEEEDELPEEEEEDPTEVTEEIAEEEAQADE